MTSAEAVRPVEIRAPRPSTVLQTRIWAGQRLHRQAPVANMATRSTIRDRLDAERFVEAFDTVARSADALRTVVVDEPGGLRLRVLDEPPARTEVIDLSASAVEAWCADRVAQPLDVTALGYDSVLLRHDDEHWTWWLDVHHVLTDASSAALIFEATAAAYAGTPMALDSFQDLLASRVAAERDPRWQEARDRWSRRPAAAPPIALYGPLGPSTPVSVRHPLALDADLRDGLERGLQDGPFRSISRELALLGLLTTVTAVLVHRTDGRSALTVGVPVHHRGARGADRIVGPLLELFPLDIEIHPGDTYRSLHRRVLRGIFDLLRRARPGTSPPGDFHVVLNVLTAQYGDFAGLPCATEWVPSGAADPDHLLRVQVYDHTGADLRVELDVNGAVGADDIRRRVPGHLGRILAAALADADASIGAVSLPDEAERVEIEALNDRRTLPEPDIPVDEAVRRVLGRDPDRVVVEDGERRLTAGAFDESAYGVARWLVEAGVRRGDRVGVRLPRSADAVIAMHAVLRAGAAFVPLDPDDPGHRHDLIVADAECALILDELPPPLPGEPVDVAGRSLDDLAYLLYTSGSTGTPKGVPISHRGLAGYLQFALGAYTDPARPPVVALHSSLVFDLTITSLFLPLLAGGTTVVFRGTPVDALAGVAADPRVDFLKCTPSQLELYLQFVEDATTLRTVVVGGEAFRRPLALALTRQGGSDLAIYNEYGPTEAVVGCMIHRFDPAADLGADVPIGGSCPDSEVFVLDAHQQLAPRGSWGELYVRRPGMAPGYRNLDAADRFAPVPAVGGAPLYRTGDRVRIERPGVAVFGGRLDEQLKVGGVRFEPGEIETALVDHPAVRNALVRFWSPGSRARAVRRCVRCGVGSDVPGISVDDDGTCSSCRLFDEVRPQAAAWFRTPADLLARRDAARRRRRGDHDCLHLLSGGKDSTYALYQLVEQGWDVHALTFDNGFISEGAKENVRRTVDDLGVSHEMLTVDAMPDIFRDSLERYANVCNGCYKTIYTLGVQRAHALGIPTIVTGLSRGQFFETRLVAHQFDAGHFDPDAIDQAVLEARKRYHRTPDAVSEHLDTSLFADDAIFEEIEFVDFYRYVDVDLVDMLRFLEERAPWVRPGDTGRSTNCLINAAGIYVHQQERGFHNYALPYSWDVRLGHKTREEALEELDDDLDEAEVRRLLERVGYEPRPQEILTAWYQAERDIEPAELRAHLRERVPEHALPAAFVRLEELPLAASAKTDLDALPAPTRIHRAGTGHSPPTTPVARQLCEVWGAVLGLEVVGIDDDFFELGGDSLAALDMVTRAGLALGVDIPDTAAFRHRTVRELEVLVAPLVGASSPAAPTLGAASGAAAGAPAGAGAGGEVEPATLSPADGRPRSVGQDALLFAVQADPASPRFGVTRRYTIEGPFDLDRFRTALEQVVAAHEALHLTILEPRREVPVAEAIEWRMLPEGTDVGAVARAQARELWLLDGGPLVRVSVVPGASVDLVLSLHHLWCSGGSVDVLWRDLATAYAGEPIPPRTAYSDYAAWQHARDRDDDLAFWRSVLPDEAATPRLELARPDRGGADGERHLPVSVAPGTAGLFARFLAAVSVALSARTDDPLVVGVPVTTRELPAVADVVGHFMNEVVVTLPRPAGGRFDELAEEVQVRLSAALRHRSLPHAELVADRRRRNASTDLLGILAVHHPASTTTLPGLEVRDEHVLSGDAVADLSLFLIEGPDGVEVAAEWSGARFRGGDIEVLLGEVAQVLEAGVRAPSTDLDELVPSVRPPDLVGPVLPDVTEPVTAPIWARATSDEPAVTQGNRRWSYRELLVQADRVAAHLIAAEVRPGDTVALVLARRPEQIAAVLGVLRVGAAYVPIDPGYPPARVEAILASAQPTVVVVDPDVVLGEGDGPRLVVDDLVGPSAPGVTLPALPGLDDPAYVIHTSGSTGAPRGVLVRHRELAASTTARLAHYSSDAPRFLWTSSYGFDSSVAGLFWTLVTGGVLVLPDPDRATDLAHLVERAASGGATHLLTVPSLWAALVDHGRDRLAGLEVVVVAGEACTPAVVATHHEHLPGVALWNEYGPTEATVWATVHRCELGERPVPIGGPVAGMVVRVADGDGRPRPLEVAGELWLGGPQVTGGYLRDPEATSARFVTDADGQRWYRTGDRVRRRPDGILEFLGRVDDQLNLRGMRIEVAEVEAVLRAVPGVREVVVRPEPTVPRDLVATLDALAPDERADVLADLAGADRPGTALVAALARRHGEAPILVAHVEGDGALDEASLRTAAAAHLPEPAVPRRVVVHAHLPRTAHGKVDRDALPLAGRNDPRSPVDVRPADATTERILAVWRRALDDDALGPDDDVFDAGMDSLSAMRAVTELESLLGRELPVRAMLDARTARALAARLGSEVGGSAFSRLRPGVLGEWPRLLMLAHYGGRGNAMLTSYLPLARGLPDGVEVVGYGLPDDALLPEAEVSIDRLASDTFDALQAMRWDEPLWVFGASINGVVALELARRWRLAGGEVAYVGLGDTLYPGEDERAQVMWFRRFRNYRDHLRAGEWREALHDLQTAVRRRLSVPPPRPHAQPLAPGVRNRARFDRGLRIATRHYRPHADDLPVVFYAASARPSSPTVRAWRSHHPGLEVVKTRGAHTGRRSFLRQAWVEPVAVDLADRLRQARAQR